MHRHQLDPRGNEIILSLPENGLLLETATSRLKHVTRRVTICDRHAKQPQQIVRIATRGPNAFMSPGKKDR